MDEKKSNVEEKLNSADLTEGKDYILYNPPMRIKKEDTHFTFRFGAGLVLRSLRDEFEIDASFSYKKDWKAKDYCDAYRRIEGKAQDSFFRVMIVQPVENRQIDMRNPMIMTKEKFYCEKKGFFEKVARLCKELYSVEEDDLYLFIQTDERNDGIIFYGYSINEWEEELGERGGSIEAITYCEYLEIGQELDMRKEEKTFQKSQRMTKMVMRIKKWLNECSFNDFCSYITERVKGQEEAEMVAINVYNYLECMAYGKPHNNNILMAAPSGCGKTETFRALKSFFEEQIPGFVIYQIDMTSITEEGFKGRGIDDIICLLKPEDNGIGIVFLDEFDKKLMPSFTSQNVNVNFAVQAQILTLIEGRKVHDKGIDTGNTMFVAMGAFDSCRQKKSMGEKHIGFGQSNTEGENHYAKITREDMIELGGCYELIGRFSSIVNYHELSYEIVDEIIDGMVRKVADSIGCRLGITDDFRAALHKKANSKFGCRILESTIREYAMRGYLELHKQNRSTAGCTLMLGEKNRIYERTAG